MRAVMYHYVRRYRPKLPNFRFLDIENFRKQLDYFERRFGFVTRDEWAEFVGSGRLPEQAGKVILTFDDAMSDHFDYVFPELLARNLWGIFYVPTAPYTKGEVLDVHRIHLLCGALDGEKLFDLASGIVTEEMVPDSKREEFRKRTYVRQKNYQGVSEFKRLLNYFIDYTWRARVIDEIAGHFSFGFDGREFYVPESGLAEMMRAGMLIGSHTENHPVMSKLSRTEQEGEIVASFDFLASLVSMAMKTYCHPYGGFHSFDGDTVSLLSKHGVQFSFNVESRQINAADRVGSIQHLPRFDCNEFEFGAAS